jgi:hypothetical protein
LLITRYTSVSFLKQGKYQSAWGSLSCMSCQVRLSDSTAEQCLSNRDIYFFYLQEHRGSCAARLHSYHHHLQAEQPAVPIDSLHIRTSHTPSHTCNHNYDQPNHTLPVHRRTESDTLLHGVI